MITLCVSNMTLELDYSVFVEQMYNFLDWNTDYSTVHIPCVAIGNVDMSKEHINVIRQAVKDKRFSVWNYRYEPTPIAIFLDSKGNLHYVDVTQHSALQKQQGNDILDLFMLCPKIATDILEYERECCK